MTTTETRKTIKAGELTIDQVAHVYSGRPGCACGCRGKHYYSFTYAASETERRGYPIDADEVRPTMIKKVYNLIMNTLRTTPDQVDVGGSYLAVETATRLYIVYPCDAIAVVGEGRDLPSD